MSNRQRIRGDIRWALRNVIRAHRSWIDAKLAYIRAASATEARIMLGRETQAELTYLIAKAHLGALQVIRAA
jgi:hypothetical protein